jgi:2-alkyl-3-oxoalkanoate reductase
VSARLVAVTGATGFLGLHLVAALAREGAKIRILARRDPNHEFWSGIEFETIHGSLEQEDALARLVDGADAVVHSAGLIKAPNRAAFLRANREGAAAVARATRQYAPQARFIAISTLAARMPEISDYAFSKHAGEEVIRAAYAGAESQLVIIRPPALYGPWDKATLSVFQAAALPVVPVLSRGRVTVVHVTDAATALTRLAMGAGEPGLFALPGGNYSMTEVSAAAMRAQGREARLLHVPASVLRAAGAASGLWGRLSGAAPVFSLGKAKEMLYPDWVVHADEALAYQPQIGLEDGFASTVAWYRAHGWLQ